MKILIITEEESAHMYVRKIIEKFSSTNVEIFLSSQITNNDNSYEVISNIPSLKSFGIVEVLSSLTPHYKKIGEMVDFVKKNKPDSVLLVDYGGYNIILSKILSKLTNVYYFIPPKVWIWGEFRAKLLAEYCSKIFTIFPFEEKYFQKFGGNVEFVGHPLVKMMKKYSNIEKIDNLITLMPGSRKNEIDFSLTPMMETVDKLNKKYKNLQFELLMADGIDSEKIDIECGKRDIKIIKDEDEKKIKLSSSIFTISVSGTAVLEAALLSTPAISLYSLNPLTMVIAKKIVNSSFVTLPNIILNKRVIPEIIGENINSELIFDESIKLLNSKSYREWILKEFKMLEEKLGGNHDVFQKIVDSMVNKQKVA